VLQTISFLVENRPGVLFKVTNLFRRRGFNIESIAVGTVQDPSYSRMTISLDADPRTLANLVEQLDKMVELGTAAIAKINQLQRKVLES